MRLDGWMDEWRGMNYNDCKNTTNQHGAARMKWGGRIEVD